MAIIEDFKLCFIIGYKFFIFNLNSFYQNYIRLLSLKILFNKLKKIEKYQLKKNWNS